jgi:hypothetical protein
VFLILFSATKGTTTPSLVANATGGFCKHELLPTNTHQHPPSHQTRVGGSFSSPTACQHPPSCQTRLGGSFSSPTGYQHPPSCQTRVGGSFSSPTPYQHPLSHQTPAGGLLLVVFRYIISNFMTCHSKPA